MRRCQLKLRKQNNKTLNVNEMLKLKYLCNNISPLKHIGTHNIHRVVCILLY